MAKTKAMRLQRLYIENVMRVRRADLNLKPGLNLVGGRNRQGKTTTVKGPDLLMGGAGMSPPEVIRKGETTAKIVGETETFTATRNWWRTDDGKIKTELEVVSKDDGSIIKSPQAFLDKLYPPEADPTAFFRMKPAERLDWLKKVVGIDTKPLDDKRQKIFDARTLVNRDLSAAEARLKAMPNDKPPPAVDTAALLKERGEWTSAQQAERQAKAERDAGMRRIADCQEAVRVAEMALAQAKVRLDTAMKQAAAADNAADDAEDRASGAAARLAQLDEQLQQATAIATANARWSEREKLAADVKRLSDDSNAKTATIEALDAEKHHLIASAKFPVDGLGFGAADVTYNGLPLEQASGAEQIRLGAEVLIARDSVLRTMRVEDGGKLDDESLATLAQICEERDMQCLMEVVGERGPATIIISDGEVVES